MPEPAPIPPAANATGGQADGTLSLGIALMLCFSLAAPGIDLFAKLAVQTIPAAEVGMARFTVQALLLLPIIWVRGLFSPLPITIVLLHALRGVLIAVATTAFVLALKYMPIADAIAIFFVEPLILTLLSAVILGEKVGWRRTLACAAGFLGALIVVQPSFSTLGWVAALPLVTALTFAFYLLLTRKLAQGEHPLVMQTYAGFSAAAFVGLVLILGQGSGSDIFDPVMPTLREAALMLGVGVMATASHLFLVYALRHAPASTLAPLQYLEIVAATGLGYLVFGDFPSLSKWVGIAIIVGAGLFVIHRERARQSA